MCYGLNPDEGLRVLQEILAFWSLQNSSDLLTLSRKQSSLEAENQKLRASIAALAERLEEEKTMNEDLSKESRALKTQCQRQEQRFCAMQKVLAINEQMRPPMEHRTLDEDPLGQPRLQKRVKGLVDHKSARELENRRPALYEIGLQSRENEMRGAEYHNDR
mmetsp:Transcript_18292/g.38216  ORF Transcript_18292/g.38216 Transcript_18292/m.38216 type:complete len:162 (+) Transcript_18292:129-614(+)